MLYFLQRIASYFSRVVMTLPESPNSRTRSVLHPFTRRDIDIFVRESQVTEQQVDTMKRVASSIRQFNERQEQIMGCRNK